MEPWPPKDGSPAAGAPAADASTGGATIDASTAAVGAADSPGRAAPTSTAARRRGRAWVLAAVLAAVVAQLWLSAVTIPSFRLLVASGFDTSVLARQNANWFWSLVREVAVQMTWVSIAVSLVCVALSFVMNRMNRVWNVRIGPWLVYASLAALAAMLFGNRLA